MQNNYLAYYTTQSQYGSTERIKPFMLSTDMSFIDSVNYIEEGLKNLHNFYTINDITLISTTPKDPEPRNYFIKYRIILDTATNFFTYHSFVLKVVECQAADSAFEIAKTKIKTIHHTKDEEFVIDDIKRVY